MFTANEVVALGIPKLRMPVSLAMKTANIALNRGIEAEKIRVLIQKAVNEPGVIPPDCPEELKAFWRELANALAECLKNRAVYIPRENPAPWKQWTTGSTEPKALQQMDNFCSLPVSHGGALMPDAHSGNGLPIGGVLAVENAVIPVAVGVDIACRMCITVLDIPPSELEKHEDRFIAALEKETRIGVGVSFKPDELRQHPVMDEDWGVCKITKQLKTKAQVQLGTSGAGNHFVEFGTLTVPEACTESGFTLPKGQYLAVLSHSGSRATGEAVARHYTDIAKSFHPELPVDLKNLAWLELNTEPGQEYWAAMELMGRYAAANHDLIHTHIAANLGGQIVAKVENHHNFAWKEMHGGQDLIVHRKGATPAGLGRLGVVPGSMGTPGYVVRGKGMPESYCSCSHGAGRKMSRTEVFATLTREDMDAFLALHGVHLLSGSLDEAPQAYKDIEQVMAAQADLVNVLARFDPRLVKMA